MVNPISSDPLMAPNLQRKDLIPFTMVVRYVMANLAIKVMQNYGDQIRHQGRISRKTEVRTSTLRYQQRASQLAAARQAAIITGPMRSTATLPSSNYLGHRLLLSTPA